MRAGEYSFKIIIINDHYSRSQRFAEKNNQGGRDVILGMSPH